MNKKNSLKLNQIKQFLLSKGFIVIKKKKITFFSGELRSFYLTSLYSFAFIIFSITFWNIF